MILRLLQRRGMNELLLFIIDVQSNFRKNDRYRYIMFCPYSKALNAVIDRKSFYYFLKEATLSVSGHIDFRWSLFTIDMVITCCIMNETTTMLTNTITFHE